MCLIILFGLVPIYEFSMEVLTILIIAILGLLFGSFFNVLADRLSLERTILGRSMCDTCNHILAWYDLIPLISFALLKGRCRYCKASLSFGYPLSELFTSAVFALTYYFSTQTYWQEPLHIIHLVVAGILIVMFLSDIRYQIIPDEMQIVLFLTSILRIYFLFSQNISFEIVKPYMLGAVVTMLPLLFVFLLSKGSGMGFGDVKYAVSMGLLLGLWNGLIGLYLAFVLGGVVGGMLLLLKKSKMKSKIAFGPFLFIATYLMMFFENDIILILSKLYRF